ncbi:MAG: Nif3-like dinuclear metal center hexameric protein [Lachnospiraceae bacterium]|nr:Nif3-like dinuclear metal center hexameric protein [Lachnospiraceae bacterium]
MKCQDIIQKLEELSPPSFAEDWDNVGLLVGRNDKEVRKIAVAVDATEDVIKQAVSQKVDMLITHHPLLFKSVKRVTNEDFIGRRIVKLLQSDISYYAMHTNFDIMGMADEAADEINLQSRRVLDVTYEDEISNEGIGRYGKLPRIMSLEECAEYIKQIFQLAHVRVYGDLDATLETAAISPGAGGDMIVSALQANVDVLITGDIKHHEALDALEQGLTIIDAGHYGLEQIFSPYMNEFFHREMPELARADIHEENPIKDI